MIAAVLAKPNAPLELREISWLQPEYGQVYVKILATGICGAQLQEIRGEKGSYFPRLLGHEAAAIVERVGSGVTKVAAGDLCVAHWRKGAGVESQSPRFRMGSQEHTAGQITTFSECSVISENRLTKVPSSTPVELCSLLGCALSTAFGTIENEANVKFGERVLIIGCGGLGLSLVLAARLRGALVYVDDIACEKVRTAISMGAKHVTESEDFDVVIDTSGNEDAIAGGLFSMAASGRFVMVGQPRPRASITIQNARHLFEGEGKSICATQGGSFNPSQDVTRYVALHQLGYFDTKALITHRSPLSKINDALDLVRNGHAGRVLIENK